jgi:hypothetical protein
MPTFKAWSFKTLSRTANGVQHYPDEPEAYYELYAKPGFLWLSAPCLKYFK